MTNINSKSSDMEAICAYALITHKQFTDYDDQVDVDGIFTDFKDAVVALKNTRVQEQNRWIPPVDIDKRDKYPFRNKIGELWSAERHFVGWGYSWFGPGAADVITSVFLQRTNIWQHSDQCYNSSNLGHKERQVLKAVSDIDYVSDEKDVPEGAKFDEETLDLILDGEEEDDSDES